MSRNDRTGAVNERVVNVAGAGWPAALTPARQREANIQKRCRLHHLHFVLKLCARARDIALKILQMLEELGPARTEDDDDLP